MYLSMDSTSLVNTAMRKKPGSLAYELAVSLYDEMDELTSENEKLETEASEASEQKIDFCSQAVYKIEEIEDRLQEILDGDIDERFNRLENIEVAMKLLNDAVIYFNRMQDC